MVDSTSSIFASIVPLATSATTGDSRRARFRFGTFLFIALVFAVFVSFSSSELSYEDRLIDISLKHSVEPEVYDLVRNAPELQALFLDYADDYELTSKARLAIEKYGDPARDVLIRYGEQAVFQGVLRRYGENAVPVIAFFVQNDLKSLRLQNLAGKTIGATIEAGKSVGGKILHKDITTDIVAAEIYGPESRGWIAISKINQKGYQFLGQFEIDRQGQAHWIQTERFLEFFQWLQFSGIREVEKKMRLDEKIDVSDVIWAAVDGLVVVSAVKVFKLLKGAKAIRSAEKLTVLDKTKVFGRPLLKRTALGRKAMSMGVKIATVYLVIRYPVLLNSVLEKIAQFLGIPPWILKLMAWTLIGLVLLYPLFALLRLFAFGIKTLQKISGWGTKFLNKTLLRLRPHVTKGRA